MTRSIQDLSKTVQEMAKRQLTEQMVQEWVAEKQVTQETVVGWVQLAIKKNKPPEAPVHPMSNGGYVDLQRLEACTTARTSLEMWVLFCVLVCNQ